MNDADRCTNCGQKFKEGVFGSNARFNDARLLTLNTFTDQKWSGACNDCGDKSYLAAHRAAIKRRREVISAFEKTIHAVPVVSIHSPIGWEYSAVSIVTGQSTTGTGIWTEVASAFTDLFGTQSGVINKKLAAGEELCKNALRVKTLTLGCNAVVAADVDYAEVGGAKALLMVCMTGTAIRLHNTDVLGADTKQAVDLAVTMFPEVRRFDEMQLDQLANQPVYS